MLDIKPHRIVYTGLNLNEARTQRERYRKAGCRTSVTRGRVTGSGEPPIWHYTVIAAAPSGKTNAWLDTI